MKRKRETISKILIALSLLLIIGASVFLFCFNQKRFIGSRVKNPDAYFLDIEKMNGTDLHTLELWKDDVIQIQFETEKGSGRNLHLQWKRKRSQGFHGDYPGKRHLHSHCGSPSRKRNHSYSA